MPLREKPYVFWMGDSIALHYQPCLLERMKGMAEVEVRQGYREAIKDLDHPSGANCGDSSMVLKFLRAMLGKAEFRAEWIVFNCGLHDIKTDIITGERQIGIEKYEKNLKEIVQVILANHRRPVWVTTTPVDDERHNRECREIFRFNEDVMAYNFCAAGVMKNCDVPLIDLQGFTVRLSGDLYCDHVHFTEEVRELQADFLASEFGALLQHEGRQ